MIREKIFIMSLVDRRGKGNLENRNGVVVLVSEIGGLLSVIYYVIFLEKV